MRPVSISLRWRETESSCPRRPSRSRWTEARWVVETRVEFGVCSLIGRRVGWTQWFIPAGRRRVKGGSDRRRSSEGSHSTVERDPHRHDQGRWVEVGVWSLIFVFINRYPRRLRWSLRVRAGPVQGRTAMQGEEDWTRPGTVELSILLIYRFLSFRNSLISSSSFRCSTSPPSRECMPSQSNSPTITCSVSCFILVLKLFSLSLFLSSLVVVVVCSLISPSSLQTRPSPCTAPVPPEEPSSRRLRRESSKWECSLQF